MLISAAAREGVNLIFSRSATAHLIVNPGDAIALTPLHSGGGDHKELPGQRVLVLTISSYLFRLLTFIHYSSDKTTDAYFNRSDSRRTLDEAFGEVGNLCCGAMKREFGSHFMHLGMSTPFTLESKCMAFLDQLKPTSLSRYRIQINQQVELHATLCLCAYGDIDFTASAQLATEDTGALELF